MKLYTEEQVKVLINALKDIKIWDEELEDEWEDCGYRAIHAINEFDKLTPIELPSDEEIEKYNDGSTKLNPRTYYDAFQDGAIWLKEQILNQNNNL